MNGDKSTIGVDVRMPAEINEVDSTVFESTNYDLDQTKATKTAESYWLRNLQKELELTGENDRDGVDRPPLAPNSIHNKLNPDVSLHLSAQDVEVDGHVDSHACPSFEVASKLYQHYSRTVHAWLPIVPATFEDQVRMYYEAPFKVPDCWLATLNLIFAIGAQHCFLVNEVRPRQTDQSKGHDDVLYLSRALQLLQMDGAALLTSAPTPELVQCLGLLSLYYLASGNTDRAWVTVGIALRLSVALGLHLTTSEPTPWHSRVDLLSRLWWSLRTLETLLSSVTGRPSTIPLQDCNVQLPRVPSCEEDNRVPGMALQTYLKISITSQWTLTSLYSVRAATLPWQSIEERVQQLKSELEKLLSAISDRERLMLHFSWFDTMIMITRPCLWSRRRNDSFAESSPATQNIANQCVQAAQAVTKLLPSEPDECIFRNGPWWCLAHYIMRAMTIFLLAMSDQGSYSTCIDTEIIPSVKKLICWLRWMRQKNPVAKKGLEVVLHTLKRTHNHKVFADIFEQEAADAYADLWLVNSKWEVDMTATYPQFVPELDEWAGLADLSGEWSNFVYPLTTDTLTLPIPPVYGNPFAPPVSSCDW
ncbi:fungal-specific transcription factor domain-containing protein [Pyrenochaeta sp. MPI-SDFR-AT-0127]|nr:fungal-specific transcription factor domain-containing protein [Pyrenochaeta sp. MPI-SDFR-AT-0127]